MANSTIMTVRELIMLAFGDSDKNTINFKHVETILYLMARQLSVLHRDVIIDPQLISDLTRKPSTLSLTEVKIHATVPDVLERELLNQTSAVDSMTRVQTPADETGHFSHEAAVKPQSKSAPIEGSVGSMISDEADVASKDQRVRYGGVRSKKISSSDSGSDRDKKPFKLEIKKPTPKLREEKYLTVHRRESEDKGSPEDKYKTVSVVTKEQYMELLNEIVQLNDAASKEANQIPQSKSLMGELQKVASITHPMSALVLSDRLEQSEKKLGVMVSALETLMKHLNTTNFENEPYTQVSVIQSAPSHKSSHDKNVTVSHVSLARRTPKKSSYSSKPTERRKEQYSSADLWSDSFRTEEPSIQMALAKSYVGYSRKNRQESETQIKTDFENYGRMPDIILAPLDNGDDDHFNTKPTKNSYDLTLIGQDTEADAMVGRESCMRMLNGSVVCDREKCTSHCEEHGRSDQIPCRMIDNLKLKNGSQHDSFENIIPCKQISNGSNKCDQLNTTQGGEKVMVFGENRKSSIQTLKSASDISIYNKNGKRIHWSEMADAEEVFDKHGNIIARDLDEDGKPILSWKNYKINYNKRGGELTLLSEKKEDNKDNDENFKIQPTSQSQGVQEVITFDENINFTQSPTCDIGIHNKNGKQIRWSELADADDEHGNIKTHDVVEDSKPFSKSRADKYGTVYNKHDQPVSQIEEFVSNESKIVPQTSNVDIEINLYNINGKLIHRSQIDLANQVYDKYGHLMPPIYDKDGKPVPWSFIDKTDTIYTKNGKQVPHVYTKDGELIPLSQEAEFIKVYNKNGDLIQRVYDKDGKLIPFSRLQDYAMIDDEDKIDALPHREDHKENFYDKDGNPIIWSQVNDFDQVYTKEGQLVSRVYDSDVKPIQWSQMDDIRLVYDEKGKLIQRLYDNNGKQVPWSLIKVPIYKETTSNGDFNFKKSEQRGEEMFTTNKPLSIIYTGPKALTEQTITTTRKTPSNAEHYSSTQASQDKCFIVSDVPQIQAKRSQTSKPIKSPKNKRSAAANKSSPVQDKTANIKDGAKQKYPSKEHYDTDLPDFAEFGIEMIRDSIWEFDQKTNNYEEVYDKNGIPILRTQVDNNDDVYDKHGNMIPRVYDKSGKPIPWSKIDDTDVVYGKDGKPILRNDGKLMQDNNIMVYDKNGIMISRSQMDLNDTIYDKNGNPIPQVYKENGQPIAWSEMDNIDNVYDENSKLIPHAYNQDSKSISLPQVDDIPIGFDKSGKENNSTTYFDTDVNPIPRLKVDDTSKLYDKNGKSTPRFYDKDGNVMPWSEIDDINDVYDKNGNLIPLVYDNDGNAIPWSKMYKTDDDININENLNPRSYDEGQSSTPLSKIDDSLKVYDKNGNLNSRVYDKDGNLIPLSKMDDKNDVYDKSGNIIPRVYDKDGNPIPWSQIGDANKGDDNNGTLVTRAYNKSNQIPGVNDRDGNSKPLSRIDEDNENGEKRPVDSENVNQSKTISKSILHDTNGKPVTMSRGDIQYDHQKFEEHDKRYDKNGKLVPQSRKQQSSGKDYVANKRRSQIENLGSRPSWHISSSTFGDLVSRSVSGQIQSFTEVSDSKIIDWALRKELKQGMQMIQDEFRKNMNASFERPTKGAEQSVQRLTKMRQQLQSVLAAKNRMPDVDSDISKFCQRITAMELNMVLEMTRYQDEITQQQLVLETAVEAMAESIANITGDPQAIEKLNGDLLFMKNDIDALSLTQRDLQDMLNNFKLDLKELRSQVHNLTSTKADRKQVAEALQGKVALADLNQVVSIEEFAAVMDELVKLIGVAYDKFNHQEHSWQMDIDEFVKCLNKKAGIHSVTTLSEDIMRNIEHLREKKDHLLSIVGELVLVCSCRQLERDDTCLCCDTAVVELPGTKKFAADKSKAEKYQDTETSETNKNKLKGKVTADRALCYPGLPANHDLNPRSLFCNRYCGPAQNNALPPRVAAPISIPKELIVKPLIKTGNALKARVDRKPCFPCNQQSTSSQMQSENIEVTSASPPVVVITLDLQKRT